MSEIKQSGWDIAIICYVIFLFKMLFWNSGWIWPGTVTISVTVSKSLTKSWYFVRGLLEPTQLCSLSSCRSAQYRDLCTCLGEIWLLQVSLPPASSFWGGHANCVHPLFHLTLSACLWCIAWSWEGTAFASGLNSSENRLWFYLHYQLLWGKGGCYVFPGGTDWHHSKMVCLHPSPYRWWLWAPHPQ